MREALGARQAREQRTCVKTKGTSSRGKEKGAGWNKTLRYLEALKGPCAFGPGQEKTFCTERKMREMCNPDKVERIGLGLSRSNARRNSTAET